ncbi:MAG: cytochrome c oxidase subunit II [Deltaproteobacteria bacterium]|nr:cytochrome c oxidase subunit II [Deltaproteobacteria bacterium]
MNEFLRRLLFLPEQASTFAEGIDQLHYFVILATIFMSSLVGLTALIFFVKYRRQSPHQTTPHVQPNGVLEAGFIGVPLALFLLWFAIGFRQFVEMENPPADSMDVYVMAKKWMWKFNYADGPNAINVLHVPMGRPVRLLLTSQDVIHSFYVPEFRIKKDAVPGRYTQTWFQATKTGRFQVLCAEYCGGGHSIMRADVIVMTPADYEQWLADTKRASQNAPPGGKPMVERQDSLNTPLDPVSPRSDLAEQGRRIAVEVGCVKCHSTDGSQHIGPSWLDMYGRTAKFKDGTSLKVDEEYMTQSIMDPMAKVVDGYEPVMPVYQNKLAGPEIAALVEYMKSLHRADVLNVPQEGPVYAPKR